MFHVELDDQGYVVVNRQRLFEPGRPFRFYLDKRKQGFALRSLMRRPSETFLTPYALRYSVIINENYLGRLFPRYGLRYGSEFKCHSIYRTSGGYKGFKSKALEHIVTCSSMGDQVCGQIGTYLSKVIRRTYESYPFEFILTDSQGLADLLEPEDFRVVRVDWRMTEVPDGVDPPLRRILRGMLAEYHEGIPLKNFDYRVLSHLKYAQTNAPCPPYLECPNLMFLTVQNHYFAGWVRNILTDDFAGKEILPLTLFML